LPTEEQAGRQLLLHRFWKRNLLDQMPAQQFGLLFCAQCRRSFFKVSLLNTSSARTPKAFRGLLNFQLNRYTDVVDEIRYPDRS
jgi:hypothetical protein